MILEVRLAVPESSHLPSMCSLPCSRSTSKLSADPKLTRKTITTDDARFHARVSRRKRLRCMPTLREAIFLRMVTLVRLSRVTLTIAAGLVFMYQFLLSAERERVLRSCLIAFSSIDHKILDSSINETQYRVPWVAANPLPVNSLATKLAECSIGA